MILPLLCRVNRLGLSALCVEFLELVNGVRASAVVRHHEGQGFAQRGFAQQLADFLELLCIISLLGLDLEDTGQQEKNESDSSHISVQFSANIVKGGDNTK